MIFRLPPPLLPFLPRAKYDIFIHARLSFVNRDGKYHVERTSSYFRIKIRFQLLFFILIFLILITWNSISSHSFNSNLETSLSKYSLKKSFYQNTTKFFQTRISKIPLSKIYLSSFSSFLFFFHPNFIDDIFTLSIRIRSIVARSPIQAMNCPLRCTERYFMFEQFACFSQFSWRASIIEGWKVGDGGRAWRKSVGPIYHRSQLARHSLPLFKTTFALFRPFRIATRSAIIPSASAFYIYIYIYLLLIYIQLHALCYYYVSLRTETWWCTEQWQGCLKLDVLVIRRHSYTGRSCNRRPGRLLQPTIRICLHNQDNNGNSERRAGDYFGQCDTYIYIYAHR